MHLLDTEVVFALRNAKSGKIDSGLPAWASRAARASLFVSALTLLELETAIARAERKDRTQGAALREWLDDRVARAFEELHFFSEKFEILGVYPADPFRRRA